MLTVPSFLVFANKQNTHFLKYLKSVIFILQSPQDTKCKDRSIFVSSSIHSTILIQNKEFPQKYRAL